MRAGVRLLAAAGLCAAAFARAEPMYVIETLVVTVNSAPDGSGERVATIRSGDKVELLDRQNDQSRVRLASGAEGWVRSSYLAGDEPLRVKLATRTQEWDQARKRVSQLESELSQARLAAASAVTQAAQPSAAPSAAAPSAAAPSPPQNTLHAILPDSDASAGRPHWRWVVLTALFSLILGFAFGWRALDRRIRRKYGGLKIY